MADLNLQNIKNPYKGVNPSNQLSGLQRWLDSIGLTNYQGKFQYQHDLASNQWESENQYRDFDLLYNTPANQAFLQRQAGLNPDLNGVSGFEAGTAGNPMNAPGQLQSEVEEPLTKIFQGIFNGVQTGIALSQGILAIRGNQLDQDVKRIKGVEDFMKVFESIQTRRGYNQGYGLPQLSTIQNKRLKRDVADAFNEVFDRDGTYQDSLNMMGRTKYMQTQKEFAEQISDPMREGQVSIFDTKKLAKNIADFNKLELELQRILIDTQKKINKYQGSAADYNEQLGSYKADADYNAIVKQFQIRVHDVLIKEFKRKLSDPDITTQLMLNSMLANNIGAFDPIQAISGAVSNLIPNIGAKFLGGGFSVKHSR